MKAEPNLLKIMERSEMFREYENAFVELTGLPVALRPPESWQLPFHGNRAENPFCAMMAAHNKTCAACLQVQDDLYRAAAHAPAVIACHFGFYEVAVPIELGNQTIGFLQTGQALCEQPDSSKLESLKAMGMPSNNGDFEKAYLASPVISKKRLDATLHFLTIFANQLAAKSNQIAIAAANAEPLIVVRGRKYVNEHLAEKLSLSAVAKAVGANPFHFCKVFRTATGVHFTEFISRTRIEKAKNLLPNHQLQIGEVAYQAGFQSLTHFNRMFRRIMGESPSSYRHRLGKLPASFKKSCCRPSLCSRE